MERRKWKRFYVVLRGIELKFYILILNKLVDKYFFFVFGRRIIIIFFLFFCFFVIFKVL